MSNDEPPELPHDDDSRDQQLTLSDEQEQQVAKWVSTEISAGVIVRRPLIHWFAERIAQQRASDGDGDGDSDDNQRHQQVTVSPEFVQGFLERHPQLSRRLVEPSTPTPPQPEQPRPKDAPPLRGRALLSAMRRRDARQALYGDAPPPARQPVPYPEGEMIHHLMHRYVVRHGDHVTKYTTFGGGLGVGDHPNEALAMRFVKEHTTIPVPAVISSDWDRITMEYVEGQTLRQAWPILTPEQRAGILDQLRGYLAQLQALTYVTSSGSGSSSSESPSPAPPIGRLDGTGVILPTIMPRGGGPFATTADLHAWLVMPPKGLPAESTYWRQVTAHLGATEYPVVFTHGDIAARNILVRDGRIVAMLDWEYAGWFPAYWEFVFTLRGLDNIDWETLGYHLPSLFPKAYDLEYVLMQFVMSLS